MKWIVIAALIGSVTHISTPKQYAEINIYQTVCVEWEADTNHVYTVWESTDMKTWSKRIHLTDYTPPYNRTVRIWRAEHEQVKFFKVEEREL
jgi:hypothetical protein